MAYVIGLLTQEEWKELERRGWDVEQAPEPFLAESAIDPERMMGMVWVDSSMFDVMNGPDWDKGEGIPTHLPRHITGV